ncbi:oligopeptide transport ATP-binding protein OppD [mine drainage metagenome]|uniref:Oligopeptide transport ATP-binding protein OppD n=1 Tax=mine drainage metagenome TaxID=410659 RepID=A0A1J5PSH8_9ZZZZ
MNSTPITSESPILSVRDLEITLKTQKGSRQLVKGISFDVAAGEAVAVVGESGSGKTLTALSIMGLINARNLSQTGGSIYLGDRNLTELPDKTFRALRGSELAMIYQDPMTSLNPLMRIGKQLTEVFTIRGIAKEIAVRKSREALVSVGLPDPDRAMASYPHEFSGGMRQRIMIALAMLLEPKLLIADEPTTALDVTIQQQILALVQAEQRRRNMGLIWITHDLGVVAELVDRVIVMYSGRIVEVASTRDLFERPQHPYTEGLIGSIPSPTDSSRRPLTAIPTGTDAPIGQGCSFKPRCQYAKEICGTQVPKLTQVNSGQAACFFPLQERS